MTQPRPRSARRPNAQYRWTRDKALAFLQALARGASVAAAAREVRMGRQSAYRLRARLGEGFAEVWDEGRARAAQGDTLPVQGDTFPAQGDTCHPQGDTPAAARRHIRAQGDTQGDTSAARRHPEGQFSPRTV